jgi:hypothetical protein
VPEFSGCFSGLFFLRVLTQLFFGVDFEDADFGLRDRIVREADWGS